MSHLSNLSWRKVCWALDVETCFESNKCKTFCKWKFFREDNKETKRTRLSLLENDWQDGEEEKRHLRWM